ncbi:ABC transporter permease [Kiritimatiellota bacterium B12222]|nr:ABC transporter permease [Kiritimatiellota bacterium B12222]
MNRFTQMAWLIRGVMIEVLRRQMLWILFLVMGGYALVSLAVRQQGMDGVGAASFMLNLGLYMAGMLAQLLTALLALRQFPSEMENRTIYPLLAKPLDREVLVLGKWLACSLGGWLVYVMFFLLAWLCAPKVENLSGGLLMQLLMIQPLLLAWVSAFSLAVSLCFPRGVSHAMVIFMLFCGDAICQWGAEKWPVFNALPRFGSVDLATRFTDGIGAVPWGESLWMFAYVCLWIVLSLDVARRLFVRRAL